VTYGRTPPVADRVVEMLHSRIRDAKYRPGDQLPSESELSAEFVVSRSSVRTALARLETRGDIIRRHGEGTFVSLRAPAAHRDIAESWDMRSLIEANGMKVSIDAREAADRTPTPEEIELFEIDGQSQVIELNRRFLGDDHPVIATTNVLIPRGSIKDLGDIDGSLHLSEIVQHCCGSAIGYVESRTSATRGSIGIARSLEIDSNLPLLRLDEIFYSVGEEKPVVLSTSFVNTQFVTICFVRHWTNHC